jgi:pyridoxine/pyridoxamine 5'-phosphate oxidase
VTADSAADARRIIDANRYLVLATADDAGRPWATPVWYAHEDHTRFLWASRPGARHSRNVAARANVSFVIFDSTVGEGEAEAVYLEALAGQVEDAELAAAVETYSARTQAHGLNPWLPADLTAPAQFRLYRATVTETFVLGPHDQRLAVHHGHPAVG